jgi:lipopolysaccharide transport system permease protein
MSREVKSKNASNENCEEWDLVIKPKPGLLEIDFREIYRYRDLMWLFVRRDFVAQYKQTILGPLWHFIQPVLTTLMFMLVFGRIAGIPTDGIPAILFYMSGITLWNYFALCLTATSNTFVVNASIFGKVYFPRLIMPLSVIFSNMIRLGVQLGLLIMTVIWYHFRGFSFHFRLELFAIPFLLILVACIALGVGIIVSSLTTKYRDFAVLLSFLVQLGMYATPIAYPMSFVSEKSFGWVIGANPLAPVVEAFRYALFGKGTFSLVGISFSLGLMLVVLGFGVLLFNKIEKSFMDTV